MSRPGTRWRIESASVVDTNVILRFLLTDHDAHCRRTERFFSRIQAGEVCAFVPDSVIAKCVCVLQKVYGFPDDEIAEKPVALLLGYREMTGSHHARSATLPWCRSMRYTRAGKWKPSTPT